MLKIPSIITSITRFTSLISLISFFFTGPILFAQTSLEPLNQQGVALLNRQLTNVHPYRLGFDRNGKWPAVCNGANNWAKSELLNFGIRSFSFEVTTECNRQVNQLNDPRLSHLVKTEPIRIYNSGALTYKIGEIASLKRQISERPSLPKTRVHAVVKNRKLKTLPCDTHLPKNPLNPILDLRHRILADSDLQSYTDADNQKRYFKITRRQDTKTELIKAEIAGLFEKKKRRTPSYLETRTMSGIDEKTALAHSGDTIEGSSACSPDHNHQDFANHFCHAMISNSVQQFLMNEQNVKPGLAHLIGTGVFAIKEKFDLNYQPDDMAFVNLDVYDKDGQIIDQKILGTVFLSGSFYVVWQGSI
jgi:hypothetical protein